MGFTYRAVSVGMYTVIRLSREAGGRCSDNAAEEETEAAVRLRGCAGPHPENAVII